jgi:hypothetical protein
MASIGQVNASAQLGTDTILVRPKRQFGQFTADVVIREVHTDVLEITDQPVEQGASIADHAYKKPAELVIEMMWSNSPQNGYPPPAIPGPAQEVTTVITDALQGLAGPLDAIASEVRQVVQLATPSPPQPMQLSANFAGAGVDQVREVSAKLLELQQSRIPFDVVTGKRAYTNMLVRTLMQTTDKETENSLHITATLRQVIIAQTVTRSIAAPAANQQDPQSTSQATDKGAKTLTQASNLNPDAAKRAGIDAVNANVTEQYGILVNSTVADIAAQVSSTTP